MLRLPGARTKVCAMAYAAHTLALTRMTALAQPSSKVATTVRVPRPGTWLQRRNISVSK